MPEHIHDKGYKRILSKKENFLSLLRDFIAEPWVFDLKPDDLELVDKEFITAEFKGKEADVIYQVNRKNEKMLFYCLIELQSSVDHTIPFRLLVYMVELLKRVFDDTEPIIRERADFRLPAIIPIVLYNGAGKWTAVKSFKEYLGGTEVEKNRLIDFSYILLDVNRYRESDLLEISSVIASVFALDRMQDKESINKIFTAIFKRHKKMNADEMNDLLEWIEDVLTKKAGNQETIREAIKYMRGGDENMMTYALEILLDEIKEEGMEEGLEKGMEKGVAKGRAEGIAEGIAEGVARGHAEVARNLLGLNMPIEQIIAATGLTQEELEALSKKE
jgi:predicted transposase/invertase (TIGR01784 family)